MKLKILVGAIVLLTVACVLCFNSFNKEDIIVAYESGDKEYVYKYVSSGGNVCLQSKKEDEQFTLFTFAICDKDEFLCDLILFNKSFSIDFELSRGGFTALHAAAAEGMNDLLKKILPIIRDVNLPDGRTALTPLGYAIVGENYETMKYLLEHKSMNVNYVNPLDKDQLTASHIAAIRGNVKALKLLAEYGADFSLKNSEGEDVRNYVVNFLSAGNYIDDEKEKKLNAVLEYLSENDGRKK